MSRIETLTFITNSGGEQIVKAQNYSQGASIIFWDSTHDEAIDGSLRSNVRGVRRDHTIRWEINTEPSEIKLLLENIITDVDAGRNFFYFGIDSDNVRRVTLDSENADKIAYNNQHGRYSPILNLIDYGVSGIILKFIDYRFIDEAIDTYLDYGLITDPVTQQEDFGELLL